jgi:hypothetical protein
MTLTKSPSIPFFGRLRTGFTKEGRYNEKENEILSLF